MPHHFTPLGPEPNSTSLISGDHPGVHAYQALDHRLTAGLLSNHPDHRVERTLRMLDPATRKGPGTNPLRLLLPQTPLVFQ